MKTINCLIPAAVVLIVVGCASERTRTASNHVSTAPQPAFQAQTNASGQSVVYTDPANPQISYRVETIPNTRLTPTSREGDQPTAVYSSNIIAVYVQTNGVRAASTNLSSTPEQNSR